MKIPQFWSKGSAAGTNARGHAVSFSCWRWSDVSVAEAQESATAAARRVLEAFLAGRQPQRYAYGSLPLREQVVDTLDDGQGDVVAAITRNNYGSLVLNAPRVMFVDIDFPDVAVGEAARYFFARLFGRAKASPEAQREETAQAAVAQFLAQRPAWGLRLYRTRAGLRGIVTHDLFDPRSEATLDALNEMGSDPLYVRLCKAQQCFRARLTPKPWRCGHHANSVTYPLADDAAAQRLEKWQQQYDARQRSYATCRFLGQWGVEALHPAVGRIVELHDFVTRSREALPLA